MHKLIVCTYCEAEFNIRHDMDEDHYRVEFCPFCGEQLEQDEDYEFDFSEDDEE